jgi:TusA-related sulfurtransferase
MVAKLMEKKVKKKLNVRGTFSPIPEINVRDALKALEDWEVLELLTDDDLASGTTIPHYCERKGYACQIVSEKDYYRIFIEKTALEKVDRQINVIGQYSPFPELRTRNVLREMPAGQTLAVLTDGEVAATKTLPHFCEKMGYRHKVIKVEPGQWQVHIEKSG